MLKTDEITFQFYENKVLNNTRVHVSDCSFCNFGQGIHPDASNENGQWSPQYASLGDARSAAFRTGRKVVECKRCIGKINMEEYRETA